MPPRRLQSYIVNALEDHNICKFRIPKEDEDTKDIFDENVVDCLDGTVASNLKNIVTEVVLKYDEDVKKAYGSEYNDDLLKEIIDTKTEQFEKLTRDIMFKEIDEVVLPVFKASILHTNKKTVYKKRVNAECIDPELRALKSECVKKDVAEYLKFYEELAEKESFHNHSVVDSRRSENNQHEISFEVLSGESEGPHEEQKEAENLTVDEERNSGVYSPFSGAESHSSSAADDAMHASVKKYNVVF